MCRVFQLFLVILLQSRLSKYGPPEASVLVLYFLIVLLIAALVAMGGFDAEYLGCNLTLFLVMLGAFTYSQVGPEP